LEYKGKEPEVAGNPFLDKQGAETYHSLNHWKDS